MGKRTRIINEPSDIVPLLRAFGSETHKKVFDALQKDWKTEEELEKEVELKVADSLDVLKKSGMVEKQMADAAAGKKT